MRLEPLRNAWSWLRDPYGFLAREAAREGRHTFRRDVPPLGPALFTGDPDVVAEIVNHPSLDAGRGIVGLRQILGDDSLIMLDGVAHRARKDVVAPAFRGEVLDRYATMLAAVTREHAIRLPPTFRAYDRVHAISLDAIARVMFGDDPVVVTEARARIARFLRTFRSPLPLFVRPLRVDLGRASPWGRAIRNRDALMGLVRERRSHGRGLVAELAVHIEGEALVREVLALLLFGHDTGAAQMTWALAHLHQHGHADRARDDAVWRDAVLRESMRASPVVVHLTRVAREPVRIGGFDVPVDGRVCPSAWLAHHHPGSWPEPSRFDPSRFLVPVATNTWFPFGLGHRVCVGMGFVMRQMHEVVGTLLRTVRLRLADGYVPQPERHLVLVAPRGGCPMVRVG